MALKDGALQMSTPFRHMTELVDIFGSLGKIIESGQLDTPILLGYTDGGPDHRLTYATTQLSLFAVFILLDLDMLAMARTAPHHSYRNPVERIMSLLNLAFQNVALCRTSMLQEFEAAIKNANSMKAIRELAFKNEQLGCALLESMLPVKEALLSRIRKLSLKEVPFSTTEAAAQEAIDRIVNLVTAFDPSLDPTKAAQKDLQASSNWQAFASNHVKTGHYHMCIKKCGQPGCKFCKPVRLPDHIWRDIHFLPDPMPNPTDSSRYGSFEDVYGKPTSGKFRPSLQQRGSGTADEKEDKSYAVSKARSSTTCYECGLPRVIFAHRALDDSQQDRLKHRLNDTDWICCSGIPVDWINVHTRGDGSQNTLYMRSLPCNSIVERVYYSSGKFREVCVHCGSPDELSPASEQERARYKVVLPLCVSCERQQKPRKTFLENKSTKGPSAVRAAEMRSSQATNLPSAGTIASTLVDLPTWSV